MLTDKQMGDSRMGKLIEKLKARWLVWRFTREWYRFLEKEKAEGRLHHTTLIHNARTTPTGHILMEVKTDPIH